MKHLICLLSAGLLLLSACDVLDVQPQNAIPASEAFKDKAGIERGIVGAYNGLQSLSYYGRSYGIFADLAADNLAHPPNATSANYRDVDNNAILPDNETVDGIWISIYDAINVANNVIAQVPNITEMTEAEQNKALGEVYFLRALHHFNLLNYFGPIPIKTRPTIGIGDVNVPRDPVEEVYRQIIADLEFSAAHLPAGGPKIRASKWAAEALLARVHLYRKDYPNAAAAATRVIGSGQYELLDNYAALFASEGTGESIFEVDFTALDRNRIAEYNFPLTLNGRREVAPDETLTAAYPSGDARWAATVANAGGQLYGIKYDDLSTGADNVLVLRLADMYLIRAEALAAQNGDLVVIRNDINQVRNRAGLPDIQGGEHAALLAAIEQERRLEFALEGHRWFDLVRTGRALDVLPKVTHINQTLFPIPFSELLTNTHDGMYQNPGY
ncbi:MAG: RagB/SusD family nutrient uptake outer membrane protein [Saprospiraceae bacterium]|nr:RagB/SusD family nutrient uptake outer membrane protein [Saprospiraceae bacterium]